jgi:hypothetical protein
MLFDLFCGDCYRYRRGTWRLVRTVRSVVGSIRPRYWKNKEQQVRFYVGIVLLWGIVVVLTIVATLAKNDDNNKSNIKHQPQRSLRFGLDYHNLRA